MEPRVRTDALLPVSHSTLDSYRMCPRMYARRKVERLPKHHGSFGAQMAQEGNDWHDYMAKALSGFPATMPHVTMERQADRARLKRIADRILQRDLPDVVTVEDRLNWGWQEGDVYVDVEAKLDVLCLRGYRAKVIDWKTGWSVPDSVEDDHQGLGYAVAVVKNYAQVEVVEFEQVQVRRGISRTATYDIDKIAKYEAYMVQEVRRLAADRAFDPTPGDHCRYCDYIWTCDAGMALMGVEDGTATTMTLPAFPPLLTPSQAQRFARGLTQWRAVGDAAYGVLKAYTKDKEACPEGRVWLDDDHTQAWGWWAKSERHVPADKLVPFIRLLQEWGIDPTEVLRIDMRAAAKYLFGNRRQAPIPGLLDLVHAEPTSYYGFKKNVTAGDADGDEDEQVVGSD